MFSKTMGKSINHSNYVGIETCRLREVSKGKQNESQQTSYRLLLNYGTNRRNVK